MNPPATSMESHENKMNAEHPSDHVLRFLRPLSPMATDFSRRCFSMSLLVFSKSLLTNVGFAASLGDAVSVAKVYTVTSGMYSLFHASLAKIRGKQHFMNGAMAGCSVGLITTALLGLNFPPSINCLMWGAAGMEDFDIISSRAMSKSPDEINSAPPGNITFGFIETVKNVCPFVFPKLPDSTFVSSIKFLAKRIIMSATMGTSIRLAIYEAEKNGLSALNSAGSNGLIASFKGACPLTQFSAIAGGVLALSIIVLKDLRGKDDGIKAGLLGCVSALFLPQVYGTANALLSGWVGSAALGVALHTMLADAKRPIIPHFPAKRSEFPDTDVLPPFTLPPPGNAEDESS